MPGALTTESLTEQPSLISDTPSNLRRRCGKCGRDHARSDKNSCLPIRPSRIVVPDQIKRLTPTCCKYPIPGCAPPYLMSLQTFVSLCTLQITWQHSKNDYDHCSGCRWSLTRDLYTWRYAADAIASCAWSRLQRRLDRNHVDMWTKLMPVLTIHMEVPWDLELALDKWPLLLRGGLSLTDLLNSCSLLASFSHASLSSSLFVPHARPASLYYVAPLPLPLCSSTRRPHLTQGAQVWETGRQVGNNQREIVTSLTWT